MPMNTATVVYSPGAKLVPCYRSELARAIPVNLPPGVTYAAGTVLGQITASANDVQTITAPGSGTYTLSGTNPITGAAFTTAALAFGANDAAVLAALVAAIGQGSSGLAVASLAVTFGGAYAGRPVPLMTASAGSVAHTTTGRTAKTYAAYASGSSDGSQVPSVILEYPTTTDSAGNVVPSSAFASGVPYATAYMSGFFDLADLVGLDANAVTKMGGAIVSGSISSGKGTFRF